MHTAITCPGVNITDSNIITTYSEESVTSNVYAFGVVVVFSCPTGYIREGSISQVCTGLPGSFSIDNFVEPTCSGEFWLPYWLQ